MRKFEAALIYYGASFERILETGDQRGELTGRARTH
ncbi:MAG: hypothetical protein ACI9BW_003901 [Gammaproteobacteria bacterium]|jgi:hypothetical protein